MRSLPLAALLVLAVALPAAPPPSFEGPTHRAARLLFDGLDRALTRVVAAVPPGPRLGLTKNFSFLDPSSCMFFDFSARVRTRVPGAAARAWLRERLATHRTEVFSTNGPISLDVSLTPLAEEGEEFLLGIELDVMVLTPSLFAKVLCKQAVGLESALLADSIAAAARAVEGLDAGVLGAALALGVEELPGLLAGEGVGIVYSAFQEDRTRSFLQRLRATLSPEGLVRHFVTAIVLTAAGRGVKALGTTVGGAVAAALFPGGAPFLAAALATRAALWVGDKVVTAVVLKVPVWWKLYRIGRLYGKAKAASGEGREQQVERYRAYSDAVIARAMGEMDQGYSPWRFLKTILNWFRFHVKYRVGAGIELAAYQPLIDALGARLAGAAKLNGSWYAARLYYQLMDSVGQLDRLGPEAPPVRGVWARRVQSS